jgi:hypothetical protein
MYQNAQALKGNEDSTAFSRGVVSFQPDISGNKAEADRRQLAALAVGHLLSHIGPQRLAGLLLPLQHFIGLFFIVHRTFFFVCGSSFTA